jgi:hypothetical protein
MMVHSELQTPKRMQILYFLDLEFWESSFHVDPKCCFHPLNTTSPHWWPWIGCMCTFTRVSVSAYVCEGQRLYYVSQEKKSLGRILGYATASLW